MIDYESLLNHEIKAVKPSGIRKFFDIANEMECHFSQHRRA